MTPDVVLAHLYVLRAQVDALILALEPKPAPVDGCPHPEDKQVNASVGGHRRVLCLACNTEREE